MNKTAIISKQNRVKTRVFPTLTFKNGNVKKNTWHNKTIIISMPTRVGTKVFPDIYIQQFYRTMAGSKKFKTGTSLIFSKNKHK